MFSVITKYHKGRHSLFLYNSEIFYAFTQDILRSQFFCNCSKNRFGRDLEGLPVQQLETMLKEDKGIDVTCNFCESKYHFNEEALSKIIKVAQAEGHH